jgi:hypothetical protein
LVCLLAGVPGLYFCKSMPGDIISPDFLLALIR